MVASHHEEDALLHLSRRRFKIMKEIAEGGFGKVYLVEMMSGDFSTVVALKLLHGKWSDNKEVVQRSRDEARVLGRLRHPNIVRVDDLTSINNQCAVVMEYVDGVNLKVLLKWLQRDGERFPGKSAFSIIADVADALQAAYSTIPLQEDKPLKLIHRDVKPSNIMIAPSGHVKLLDFGTAQARFDSRESKTQAMTFGSKGYMSPERMMQEEDTPAGDIFSLGVILYWLLSGEQLGEYPLRPTKYEDFLDDRLDAMDLSTLDPAVHDDAINVLSLMLAHDHTARPSSLQVMELCEILGESAGGAAMRPFCRQHIPPIQSAWNAHTDGKHDELVGAILNEDRTSSVPYPAALSGDAAAAALNLDAESLNAITDEVDVQLPAVRGRKNRRAPTEAELRELPLSQKLKQDVSVRTLKSVFTHEIRLGRRKKPGAPVAPALDHVEDAPTNPTLAESTSVDDILHSEIPELRMDEVLAKADEAHTGAYPKKTTGQVDPDEDLSLSQKLQQDISMRSLKSVLTHDIRFFGKRKK